MDFHAKPKCDSAFLVNCREEKNGYHSFRVQGLFGIDSSHLINHTAWEILMLCDGTREVSEIVKILMERYSETTSETNCGIENDVASTILAMMQLGTVTCEQYHWIPMTPFVKRIKEGRIVLCDYESSNALKRFFSRRLNVFDLFRSSDNSFDPIFYMSNVISQEIIVALVLDTGEIGAVVVFGVLLDGGEEEVRLIRVAYGERNINISAIIFHSIDVMKEGIADRFSVSHVRAIARSKEERKMLEAAGFQKEICMNELGVTFYLSP